MKQLFSLIPESFGIMPESNGLIHTISAPADMPDELTISPGERVCIPTGIEVCVPWGFILLLQPSAKGEVFPIDCIVQQTGGELKMWGCNLTPKPISLHPHSILCDAVLVKTISP